MSDQQFQALAPRGFDTALQMREGCVNVSAIFIDLLSNNLIALGNNDQHIDDKSSSASYESLTEAFRAFQAMSTLPLPVMQNLVTYAEIFAQVVPADVGLDDPTIAVALDTIVQGWKVVDNSGYNEQGVVAKNSLAKIGNIITPCSASAVTVGKFMASCLKVDLTVSVNEWSTLSLLDIYRAILLPLIKLPDQSNAIIRLNTILDLTLTPKQYAMTFPQLVKADKTTANLVLAATTNFTSTLKLLLTQLNAVSLQISSLTASYAGLLSATDQVPQGIKTFAENASTNDGGFLQKSDESVRDKVLKGWAIVGQNAGLYVQNVGRLPADTPAMLKTNSQLTPRSVRSRLQKQSRFARSLASTKNAVAKNDANDVKSPEEVRQAFGAPENASGTFADMAATSFTIQQAFDDLLTVPYADELVVTLNDGTEKPLRGLVVSMQADYQALQAKTLPVAKDLHTTAALQMQLLPEVNKPNNVTLEQYLVALMNVVLTFSQSAQGILRETTQLRDRFRGYLEIFDKNLADMKAKIESTKQQIATVEKQYVSGIVTTCIEFVVGVAFGIAAVVALLTGVATPIGVGLGVAAIGTLGQAIAKAVETSQLAGIISNLESMVKSYETTRDRLQDAIPKLSKIVDLVSNMGDIWSDIIVNLKTVQDNAKLWDNPIYFTQPYIDSSVASWKRIGDDCSAYADIVGGFPPANAISLAADPAFADILQYIEFDPSKSDEVPPPAYSAFADQPLMVRLALEGNATDSIRDFLSAPAIEAGGLRRDEVQNCASSWLASAQALQSIGESGLANLCVKMGEGLQGALSFTMDEAIKDLLQFASSQPQLPQLPATPEAWDMFCSARLASLAKGNSEAVLADARLRELQNRGREVYDLSIARRKEYQDEADRVERDLKDAQEKYNSYSWLKWIPNPIAIIIGELVDRIRGDTDRIRDLSGRLKQVDESLSSLDKTSKLIDRLDEYTRTLSAFWASMTTKTHTAVTLWQVLEKYPAQELEYARKTWQTLESAFGNWS